MEVEGWNSPDYELRINAADVSKDQEDSIRKAFALKQILNGAMLLNNPALQMNSEFVVPAVVLTLVVSTVLIIQTLTVFARQWAVSFRISPPFLYLLFVVSGTWYFLSAFVPSMSTEVCALGVLLIGVFIIVDTILTVEGGKCLGNCHYMLAAIILDMDLMSLFLRMLELQGKLNK